MAKIILTVLMKNGSYECRKFDLDQDGRAKATEYMNLIEERLRTEGISKVTGDDVSRKIYKDGFLFCEMFTIVEA